MCLNSCRAASAALTASVGREIKGGERETLLGLSGERIAVVWCGSGDDGAIFISIK